MDYRIRNLLLILIAVGLIASLLVGARRFVVEYRDREVELAVDWNDIVALSQMDGVPVKVILKQLKDLGVGSVALTEDTLDTLERRGELTWFRGSDAFNVFRITAKASFPFRDMLMKETLDPQRYYMRFTSVPLYRGIRDELSMLLGREQVRELNNYILEVEDDEWDLAFLGMGLPQNIYADLKNSGFKVLPRLKNSFRITSDKVSRKLNFQKIAFDDNIVIFDEEEVLGYPFALRTVASELSSRNIRFGYIEFSEQLGDRALTSLMREDVVRIHSIPADEMEIMTQRRALGRWLRAVRERSVRVLYIHPFMRPAYGKTLVETNLSYIGKIIERLGWAGYRIGDARSQAPLGIGFIETILMVLGVLAALIFLTDRFIRVPDWAVYLSIIICVAMTFAFGYSGKIVTLRKLAALAAAVSFPSLAIIVPFSLVNVGEMLATLKQRIMLFFASFGISLCGALFVVGLLSETLFRVGAEKFAGVKLALIVPLGLVALYFLLEDSFKATLYKAIRILRAPFSVGHVVLFGVAALFALVFILRSGNFGIAVPGFERYARDLLELAMVIRPRTKEFLLGYPVLVLLVYYYQNIPNDWLWLPASVAAVSGVSLVNTFCHIHSPLLISALRSVNGLITGIMLGCAAVLLIEIGKRMVNRYGH